MVVEKLQGTGIYGGVDDTGQPGELDSDGKYVPVEFETFEHGGELYHAVGLLQFWWRGYTDEKSWSDPPQPSTEFTDWMRLYGVRFSEPLFGPPHLVFPDSETAELFRAEWHQPGEVQRGHYYEWCHRPKGELHRTTHEDMDAAMERAKAFRREWIKERGTR